MSNTVQTEITRAADALAAALAANPARNQDTVWEHVMAGTRRPHAAFYLWRGPDINAGEVLQPMAPPPPKSPEERVLDALRGAVGSLDRLNPISSLAGGLGKGTGTLPASFGVHLEPTLGFTPMGSRPLDEVLAEGMPNPATSGLMPDMHTMIDAFQALTPPWVKIGPPDMQGPFNIVHMILGDEAFIAPITEPDKFQQLMTLITDFYIAVHKQLQRWIEPRRWPRYPGLVHRIAECSVNMISKEMYLEHCLPHDRRIVDYFGETAIHPCSGPHVFYATLENLPNIVYHEAGFIEKACAGSISVKDAMAAIGERPIILGIGEELPVDFDEAERVVRGYFDLARKHPRLTYGFTGMYWRQADEPRVLDLHRRLDDYWQRSVAAR